MKYQSIFWDFDDTICETSPSFALAFQLAVADARHSVTIEQILPLVRQSFGVCASMLSQQFGLDQETLEERFVYHYSQISPREQPLYPYVQNILQSFHDEGGTHFLFTHRSHDSAVRFMDVHSILDLFTDILSVGDGYPRKPDAGGFLALLKKHDLDRSQVLEIGDREIDVAAGQEAGIMTCLFGENPIATAQPDYRIHSYAELDRILF